MQGRIKTRIGGGKPVDGLERLDIVDDRPLEERGYPEALIRRLREHGTMAHIELTRALDSLERLTGALYTHHGHTDTTREQLVIDPMLSTLEGFRRELALFGVTNPPSESEK